MRHFKKTSRGMSLGRVHKFKPETSIEEEIMEKADRSIGGG
jgi:hypothetical protein